VRSTARGQAKPRILFAINSLAGGGAERVFTSLLAASETRSRDYNIAVALLDEDPPGYALPAWVPVHRLNCRHSFLLSTLRLSSLVASLRPDVMLSFLTRANVATAVAMRFQRRPFIVSERIYTSGQLSRGRLAFIGRAMVRLTYPAANRVIAVSKGVGETLQTDFGVRGDRIDVINNPVDAAAIRSLAKELPPFDVGPDDIVLIGRFAPQKNIALAVRAFARSGWPGRLILLGEGPLAGQLKALADELGVGDRILFPGFLKNPYAVLGRAALLLLTSNEEGFSNSLVEAMSLGVPVIATDCPFSPAEILRVSEPPERGQFAKGTGGLLVPVGDEDAVVRALEQLKDQSLRAKLAREGEERVEVFSGPQLFEQYWKIIAEVAGA
jgi:glycosyltransferase involved in cell wall biosynthesis